MNWEKNVFSYLLWVLYAVMAEVGLVCLADAVCDSMGLEIYIGTITCAIYIVAAGLGVYLVHRFAPKYTGADEKGHSVRTLLEAAITVILLVLGVVLRVQRAGGAVEENVYYELAAMVSEEEIPRSAHGAVSFYIQMLHGLFYFFGNKPAVAVCAQILLQLGAMLLLFFAVRRSAGSIAAIVMLGFGMFSSCLLEEASHLSPSMLYLFLWSAALLLTVAEARAKKSPGGFLIAGLAISVVSYLDVAGCLLLLVLAAVIFSEEEVSGTGRKRKSFLLCLTGAGAGFAGCALVDSLVSGKTFTEVLAGWIRLYRPSDFRLPVSVDVPGTMAGAMVEYIILFCVLTLGMFSFWRDRRRDHRQAWTLLLIVLVLAGCFGIFTEEMPMGLYLYLVLAIMAGIAVEECICEIKPVSAEAAQIPAEIGMLSGEADAASQTDGEAAPRPGKVKLIENPLPLPKRHVRKKLDYDVNVSLGKDDFDLDVDEKDDFDI